MPTTQPYAHPSIERRQRAAAAARALQRPDVTLMIVAQGHVTAALSSLPVTRDVYDQLEKRAWPCPSARPLAVCEVDGKLETFATVDGRPVRLLGVANGNRLPRLILGGAR